MPHILEHLPPPHTGNDLTGSSQQQQQRPNHDLIHYLTLVTDVTLCFRLHPPTDTSSLYLTVDSTHTAGCWSDSLTFTTG